MRDSTKAFTTETKTDYSAIFLVFWDRNGSVISANVGYQEYFGNGQLHPDDEAMWHKCLKQAFDDPRSNPAAILRRMNASGQYVNLHCCFGAVGDVVVECSSLKVSNLHVLDEYYLLDCISEAVGVLDKEFRFVYINRAASEMMNLAREEIIGKIFWDLYPAENPGFSYPIKLHEAKKSGKPTSYEEHDPATGRWFGIYCLPIGEELIVITRDITFQKLNYRELLDSQFKLHAILESTSDAFALIASDFSIICFNRSFADYIKIFFNKNVQVGEDVRDYVVSGAEEIFLRNFNIALSGQKVNAVREVNGIWFDVHYQPAYNHEHEIIGVIFNAINIDQYKRVEIKLIEQNQILRQVAQLHSHDIRRPLANILGLVELISDTDDPEQMKEMLEYLRRSAKLLDDIIHTIVMASSGKQEEF